MKDHLAISTPDLSTKPCQQKLCSTAKTMCDTLLWSWKVRLIHGEWGQELWPLSVPVSAVLKWKKS